MTKTLEDSIVAVFGYFIDDPLIGENYFGALRQNDFLDAGGSLINRVLALDFVVVTDELEFIKDWKFPEDGIFFTSIEFPLEIDLDAESYTVRITEDWTPSFESNVLRFTSGNGEAIGAETIIDNKLLQVDYASPIPFEPIDPRLYYTANPSFNTFAVNFSSDQGTYKEGTVYTFGLDFQLPITDTPPTDPATPPDEISANWIDPVTGQNLNDNLANGSLAEGMYRGRRDQFGLARNFSSDDEITLNVKNSEKFDSITGNTTYSIIYHSRGINAQQAIDRRQFLSSKSFDVNEGEKARVSFNRYELKEFNALGKSKFSLYDWDSGETVKTFNVRNSKSSPRGAGNAKFKGLYEQDFALGSLTEVTEDSFVALPLAGLGSRVPDADSFFDQYLMPDVKAEFFSNFSDLI